MLGFVHNGESWRNSKKSCVYRRAMTRQKAMTSAFGLCVNELCKLASKSCVPELSLFGVVLFGVDVVEMAELRCECGIRADKGKVIVVKKVQIPRIEDLSLVIRMSRETPI